ncbi:MAG: hypothetical protein LBE35_07700, partial [Clostridiales bacterium]|nr:hypothetical protein [Clostridiales bacterium]
SRCANAPEFSNSGKYLLLWCCHPFSDLGVSHSAEFLGGGNPTSSPSRCANAPRFSIYGK